MDRENVIKGLEQFKADFKPFCGNGSDWARIDDAISMLKEQDDLGAELTNAVELIHKKNERIKELLKEQETEWEHLWDAPDGTFKGRCKKCGFVHFFIDGHDTQYKFCPECGRPAK